VRSLRLRDAKASLSAVVEAASRGEATTITKHGKPAAVVVSVEDARRLYSTDRPNFADLLMSVPDNLDVERDPSPFRDADL
jgi:prevent-host-death family protein